MGAYHRQGLGGLARSHELAAALVPRRGRARATPGPKAMLGGMYQQGLGGLQASPERAAAWFLKAARQGDQLAQLQLGQAHTLGEGVAKDPGAGRLLVSCGHDDQSRSGRITTININY
jgi:TPR repeat protein